MKAIHIMESFLSVEDPKMLNMCRLQSKEIDKMTMQDLGNLEILQTVHKLSSHFEYLPEHSSCLGQEHCITLMISASLHPVQIWVLEISVENMHWKTGDFGHWSRLKRIW